MKKHYQNQSIIVHAAYVITCEGLTQELSKGFDLGGRKNIYEFKCAGCISSLLPYAAWI